jgi:ribosomal protein S21
MVFPDDLSSTTPTMPVSRPPPRRETPQLRLSSRTGKTLEVLPNDPSDLALKLRRLNMTVARNKVPQDFQKQRFHERPGLKRKRLKSQRWRARFKKGFSRIVGRVGDMRRMGW